MNFFTFFNTKYNIFKIFRHFLWTLFLPGDDKKLRLKLHQVTDNLMVRLPAKHKEYPGLIQLLLRFFDWILNVTDNFSYILSSFWYPTVTVCKVISIAVHQNADPRLFSPKNRFFIKISMNKKYIFYTFHIFIFHYQF